MPYLPTVNAIAPKAPTGASRITRLTISKSVCPARSSLSASGFARGPRRESAIPNSTANRSTGRISPRANAPTMLSGITSARSPPSFLCE